MDDDPAFLELAELKLESELDGFEVLPAESAEEALEILESDEVACVVSDYDMPGCNGLDILDRVRERCPEMPFVLFTGKGSEDIASEAVSRGVSDYYQKGGPESFELLANEVESLVKQSKTQRESRRRLEAMENVREGIAILDEEGRFVYVNPAYAEMYGYDPDEMEGEHWEMLYRDEDEERVRQEVLPEAKEGGWTGESVHVTAEGEDVVTDHSLTYSEHGDMICMVRRVEREE